ncbi:uncharacterized protein LODBEIA_P53180 [Lodderomyces beijingensis]|uniref:Receptor L-domain domain-containing protein n=1 Tax=Lodderomyces beijingensis TaxID=1775926 RepID=A0ABP0ZSK5_9ASCO
MQISFILALAVTAKLAFADDDTTTSSTTSRATTTSASATTSGSLRTTSTNPCSFSRTTMSAATAVGQLNACSTLDGDITITGNEIGVLDLSGVEEIKGDLTIFNAPSLVSLNFNRLETISGSLVLNNNTHLQAIDMTSLTVADDLQFISLPGFATLNLNQGVSRAGRVVLSDTALENLNGLAHFDTIDYMNINNNKNIVEINFEDLETVTDALILSFNHDDAVVSLNSLRWAGNLTVQDVAEFSARNLTAVNGSLSISYNSFESLNISSLTTVGSSLQVFANDEITDLSFGSLREIGGELRLFNNTLLEDLNDSFSALQRVRGAVSITGPIANFSVASLERVDGDFELTSTSEDFDCSRLDELHDDGDIQGHNYVCTHAEVEASLTESTSTGASTTTAGGSTTTRESNADKPYTPAGMLACFLAGVLTFL